MSIRSFVIAILSLFDRGVSSWRRRIAGTFVRRTTCTTAFVAMVVTALCPNAGFAIEFEQIQTAWQNRQESAKSVELHWSEQRTAPVTTEDGEGRREVTKKIPDMAIFMLGNRVRLEDESMSGSPHLGGPFIEVFKEKQLRRLSFSPPGEESQPQGTINPDGERPKYSVGNWPPLLIYRGVSDDLLDCSLSDFQHPTIETVAGTGDLILRGTSKNFSNANGKLEWALTVRPFLDFAPVRLTGTMDDSLTVDVQIEVERGDDSMLRPTKWSTLLLTPKGKLILSGTAKVTSCDINQQLDDSLFNIDFPVGTFVADLRPTTGGGQQRYFMVRKDGEREVLREELARGASRQQLMETGTGEAGTLQPENGKRWPIAINVALIIILVVLVLIRRLNVWSYH